MTLDLSLIWRLAFLVLNLRHNLTRIHSRYAGVEIRATPARTEIIIHATRTAAVLGENGRRIRELTYLIQKRFGFADGAVDVSCALIGVGLQWGGDD